MTGYEHIHADFRHVMELSAEQRIKFLDEPRWIGYKDAKFILDTLQGLLSKPTRLRMPNLLIVGDSNNGKSSIIDRFYSLCGQPYIDENADSVKPVIVAESPSGPDEKALYASILEQFCVPYSARDPVPKLCYQVIHQFRACHVKMLVIDELHSLLTGTPVKQREIMNAIKLLCNELMIPIVGVGTRDAVRILHTDPQHASRFDMVTLPSWKLDAAFQRLLADFEKVLPLKRPSRLHEPEKAKLFHAISNGNLGDLHRLLIECAIAAISSGNETIDVATIESKNWMRPTNGIRELRR